MTAQGIANLTQRVQRIAHTASTLPLDAFRTSYLADLASLDAELVEADPGADGHYRLLLAEHASLMRRSEFIRDRITDFALLATGSRDPQTKARAELLRRRLVKVEAYLLELEHQAVARSWKH